MAEDTASKAAALKHGLQVRFLSLPLPQARG